MTPSQAALIIGCSPQNVRTMIRGGKMKAKKLPATKGKIGNNRHGHVWSISSEEAERVRQLRPVGNIGRGRPRGVTR